MDGRRTKADAGIDGIEGRAGAAASEGEFSREKTGPGLKVAGGGRAFVSAQFMHGAAHRNRRKEGVEPFQRGLDFGFRILAFTFRCWRSHLGLRFLRGTCLPTGTAFLIFSPDACRSKEKINVKIKMEQTGKK